MFDRYEILEPLDLCSLTAVSRRSPQEPNRHECSVDHLKASMDRALDRTMDNSAPPDRQCLPVLCLPSLLVGTVQAVKDVAVGVDAGLGKD